MRELFDYLDNADPWALIAALFALLFVVEAIGYHFALRAVREANRVIAEVAAHERLAGYDHGHRDGSRGQMPAYRAADVPSAFTRESYGS